MLRIYGRANSLNVRKVLWAAEEIAIPYEREDWGRGFRSLDEPEYRRLNPFGLVPAIDDGGRVLRESNTIVRYLAAKHGRSDLYPTDLVRRAEAEAWMDWANSDLLFGCRAVFIGHVLKAKPYDQPEQISAHLAQWTQQMRHLDACLAAVGPYVMGADFTVGDIPVGLIVHRWYAIDIPRLDLPAVENYYRRLGERPAYRAHGCNAFP